MKKYAVDINFNWKGCYDAGPKARVDVSRTLKKLGYRILCINHKKFKSKKLFSINRKLQFFWLYLKHLRNAECVVFQYPGPISIWLLEKLRKNRTKIIILIHDLENIREEKEEFTEKAVLDFANEIISHTPRMTECLKQNGISCDIQNIYLFDYYVENAEIYHEDNRNSIVFCGNLAKSPFIQALDEQRWKLKTYLYGKGYDAHRSNPYIEYMGAFHSDNVSNIKGAWGLVWDGDSIENCNTSKTGRYLKYNSSHKVSLYIVAEKPLIVWKESALAEFVEENRIGISISSLLEIETVIRSVTKDDYENCIDNIKMLKAKLVNGKILSQAINNIENK